jgi:hypothetical protein
LRLATFAAALLALLGGRPAGCRGAAEFDDHSLCGAGGGDSANDCTT